MAKEEKIKLTDISVPKGWKYFPFGDVFEFIQSNALSREQLTFDEHEGEIFNIHYGDIHSTYKTDLLDLDKEQKVPRIKDIVESKSLAFLKDGDLIIADASEDYEGVAANLELKNIKKKKVTGGLHTFVARDNSGLTVQGFRTYVLKNPAITINLKKLATGSKVYGVSKTNLATLKVLLPPEEEQIKIAQILSTWDNTIETLEQLIAKKERNKKALMQQLLTGKKRFKEFKDKWEMKSLKDVCVKIQDGNYGADYPTSKEFLKSGIPFLTSKAIGGNGILDINKVDFISEEKHLKLKKAHLQLNDVLFTNRGANVGSISIVDERISHGNIGPQLTLLRCNESIIYPFFLKEMMISNYVQKQVRTNDSGSAMNFFGIGETSKFKILVPKLAEQIKITNVFQATNIELQSLKDQLDHSKNQKQGLMQLLLTGQKRVKI